MKTKAAMVLLTMLFIVSFMQFRFVNGNPETVTLACYVEYNNIARDSGKMNIVYASLYKVQQQLLQSGKIVLIDMKGSWSSSAWLYYLTLQEAISRTSGVVVGHNVENNFESITWQCRWNSYWMFQLGNYYSAVYIVDDDYTWELSSPQWRACLVDYISNADQLASKIVTKIAEVFGCSSLSELAGAYNGKSVYHNVNFVDIWGKHLCSYSWIEKYQHWQLQRSYLQMFTEGTVMVNWRNWEVTAIVGMTSVLDGGGINAPIYYSAPYFNGSP